MFDKALIFNKKSIEYKDSLFSEEKSKQLEVVEYEYKAKRKDDENRKLLELINQAQKKNLEIFCYFHL